jgi:hypothetical protein
MNRLQGKGLQETHPPQGHSVQEGKGLFGRPGKEAI